MNCKKCGFQLTENDQFCKNCGTPVNNTSVQNNNEGLENQNTQTYTQQQSISQQPMNNYSQPAMQQPSWTSGYNAQPINQAPKNQYFSMVLGTSVMSICPGAWVMAKGTLAAITAA